MAHYRDTYRPARFLFLDVRVGVIILASLLHVTTWTITIDVAVIILAIYVERIGLGFMGTFRALRAWFSGSYRPALQLHKIRRAVDYERVYMAWEKMPDTSPLEVKELQDERSLLKGKL